MALNPHVRSSFSDHMLSHLEKKFLSILRAQLHTDKYGMKKMLSKHSGNTMKWNRWSDLSAQTTALTEAVSPNGQTLSSAAVTATVNGYGGYVTISDFLQMTAINDTLRDATELMARQAALTVDRLNVNELQANGTQAYSDPANNSSKANVESGTDVIASSDLRLVNKNFKKNNVPTFEDDLFRGIINPLMEFDLISESSSNDFVILAANTSNEVQERGEIGTAYGIKLVRSTNVVADGTSTNTYGNIFVGKDAYGTVDLESAGTKIIVKPTGSAGTEDPINQRATTGWKLYYAVKVLEAARTRIVWAYNAG